MRALVLLFLSQTSEVLGVVPRSRRPPCLPTLEAGRQGRLPLRWRKDQPWQRRLPLLWTLCLVGFVTLGSAVAQEIEVTTVNFNNVRAPTGSIGTWLETEITLNVKAVPGNPSQMVSRVRVSLLLGFELPATAGAERRLEHYRAEAECVALEPGRAYIRFYLPPELVKRDQLHGDPKYWGVELAVGGRALPPARAAYSPSLATAEQRKNFQTRAGTAAVANDGILLPQFLTPFENEHPRATPSFVRPNAR